jgi:hypothetical protein
MIENKDRAAVSVRTMELAVAGIIFALGVLVMWSNWRLGARWVDDGPQPGYFPFYIGLILCIASGTTFVQNLIARARSAECFVTRGQIRLVMTVLVPTIVYCALIKPLGIYVASIVFMAWFMKVLGKYSWVKVLAISIGLNVVLFAVFEFWFRVPLPKGPLEAALGLL